MSLLAPLADGGWVAGKLVSSGARAVASVTDPHWSRFVHRRSHHRIGGRGQHLGEKENAIQGAESGANKAKTVATGAYGVGRSFAGDVARKRGQARAAGDEGGGTKNPQKQSTTNPTANADNLSGGEATEKMDEGVTKETGQKD